MPHGLTIIKDWLGSLGPFLGAILVFGFFKLPRQTKFFGTSKLKSFFMLMVPLLLFAIIGAKNTENINSHVYGFLLGFALLVYCILEETGWRGYLQDELKYLNPFLQYSIVGVLWYAWHLSFLSGSLNLINEFITLLILVAASIGIGFVVKSTKSIIAAACMHMIGNILAFSTLLKESINSNNRMITVVICLVAWIIIIHFWNKKIPDKKEV